MEEKIKMRVVVLEDDKLVRKMLERTLKNNGYEVYAFTHTLICPLQINPECRCAAGEYCTDVLLVDIKMPFMNCLKFLENNSEKKCKAQNKIIYTTVFPRENDSLFEQYGFKTFDKIDDLDELIEYLEEVEKGLDPNRRLKDWFKEIAA